MMKKVIFNLHAIMMIAMLCVGLCSCSKDDDKDSTNSTNLNRSSTNNSEIVGVWIWQEDNYKETLSLNNDGSFSMAWIEGRSSNVESGTWAYDTNDKKLTLNTVVGEKPGSYTFTVKLAGNTMTLVERDGDVLGPYVKQ